MDSSNIKDDRVISLRLHAKLDEKEEAELSRLLEEKIGMYGKVRLFLVLENYPVADSAESLLEDMGFIKLHAGNIEKLAVVGERAWQETWVALFGLFGGLETAYFDHPDMDEAEEWIAE